MFRASAKSLNVAMVSQDEVIETCGIVSLHAHAAAENHHLFNAETIARMNSQVLVLRGFNRW